VKPGVETDTIVRSASAGLFARWRERRADGAPRIGWKIGVNDPAMMRRLGLSRSVVGVLAREIRADAPCRLPDTATVGVEAEIAITMARDLPGGGSVAAAAGAIGGIGPALEIVDVGRLVAELGPLIDGNILHEAVHFGAPPQTRPGASLDGVGVTVARNGETLHRAGAADVLGDLAPIAKLVADTLAEHGESLAEGDRIISGALTPIVRLRPGDALRAEFGALGALGLEIPRSGGLCVEAR
jgi:2-keto-4-pentenoate hydratase